MQMDDHGRITWSPTKSDVGAHYVQVSVADDHGGSVGQGFDLHVVLVKTKETNQSPQIISTPPLVIRVGDSYRYDAEAVDEDRDTLLWTLLTGPDGMSLDAQLGTLRWTPRADQVGSHDVSLRVTDGRQGLAAQSFEIRVLAADEQPRNAPPSITSLPKTEIKVGSSYGYDVRAWDPNGDPLTFHLDAGPPHMKIDPQGRITWSPATGDVGTHYVQVTVADDRGAWIGQGYELNVVRSGDACAQTSPRRSSPRRRPWLPSRSPTSTIGGHRSRRGRADMESGDRPRQHVAGPTAGDVALDAPRRPGGHPQRGDTGGGRPERAGFPVLQYLGSHDESATPDPIHAFDAGERR